MRSVKVFISAYNGGNCCEIGVYSGVSARLLKAFGWNDDGYKEANEWCEKNGYEVETDHCKTSFVREEKDEETIPLSRVINAYKEYAIEQIRGGEADIGMLDIFFRDYLRVDTGTAYDEALIEAEKSEKVDD